MRKKCPVETQSHFRMIPSPKKTVIDEKEMILSQFDSDVKITLTKSETNKRINTEEHTFVLPPVFVTKSKDFIEKHIEQIRAWFNPSPSASTIRNVITIPPQIDLGSKNISRHNGSQLRIGGIIVESSRILPYIILDFVEDLTQTLTFASEPESLNIEDLEEVTNDIHIDEYQTEDEADDDDDEADDDGEDSDEDTNARFEMVQRNLDAAREELERLRRLHYRK